MTTLRNKVLQHLQEHGVITSIEAIQLYGATRLSSIIFDLRKQGYNIETIMCDGTTRYGNHCKYGVYKYKGENK